jgi:hypothetical protein
MLCEVATSGIVVPQRGRRGPNRSAMGPGPTPAGAPGVPPAAAVCGEGSQVPLADVSLGTTTRPVQKFPGSPAE